MSTKKMLGTLYMYSPHPRYNRLQAVAQAVNGEFKVETTRPPQMISGPEFAKFPLRTVPAFESADGKVCLTEASAICEYLCLKYPECGLMPTNVEEIAQVHNWMFICEAEIITFLGVLNRSHMGMYTWSEENAKGILGTLHRRMDDINAWVGKHKYLVGDHFTLADITLASVLGHGYSKFLDKEWREKYTDAFQYYLRIIKEPQVAAAFETAPPFAETTPPPVKRG